MKKITFSPSCLGGIGWTSFNLKLSKKIQPEADTQCGKFQPKQLKFGSVVGAEQRESAQAVA